MKRGAGLLAVVLLLSCRTEIRPLLREQPAVRAPLTLSAECVVHDYQTSTDIPDGAKQLGWVSVPRQPTDEETFIKLRQAVCAKGGTAFSQAHWNRPAGASVADPPSELEANAWLEADR